MTVEELATRLELVERSNRRLRAMATAAAVVMAAIVALGQVSPPPKEIEAMSFALVDEGGNRRGALCLADGPRLFLQDDKGGTVSIETFAGIPRLSLRQNLPNKTGGECRLGASSLEMEYTQETMRDWKVALHSTGLVLSTRDSDSVAEGKRRAAEFLKDNKQPDKEASQRVLEEMLSWESVAQVNSTPGFDLPPNPWIRLNDRDGKTLFRAP